MMISMRGVLVLCVIFGTAVGDLFNLTAPCLKVAQNGTTPEAKCTSFKSCCDYQCTQVCHHSCTDSIKVFCNVDQTTNKVSAYCKCGTNPQVDLTSECPLESSSKLFLRNIVGSTTISTTPGSGRAMCPQFRTCCEKKCGSADCGDQCSTYLDYYCHVVDNNRLTTGHCICGKPTTTSGSGESWPMATLNTLIVSTLLILEQWH